MKKRKELIPTQEDRERTEEGIKRSGEHLMEILVREEARVRIAGEEAERRRERLNRLSLGLLGRH